MRLAAGVPGIVKLIADCRGGTSEVSGTEGLHIFDGDSAVAVDIQGLEEGVDVFLLGIEGRVKDVVGISQNGHGLSGRMDTLTGSIEPERSLS